MGQNYHNFIHLKECLQDISDILETKNLTSCTGSMNSSAVLKVMTSFDSYMDFFTMQNVKKKKGLNAFTNFHYIINFHHRGSGFKSLLMAFHKLHMLWTKTGWHHPFWPLALHVLHLRLPTIWNYVTSICKANIQSITTSGNMAFRSPKFNAILRNIISTTDLYDNHTKSVLFISLTSLNNFHFTFQMH